MWSRPWIVLLVVLAAASRPTSPAARRSPCVANRHERHVGVAEDLRAERAADVRADAADLVLRDADHERGQQQPLDVRASGSTSRSCTRRCPGCTSPMSPRTSIGLGIRRWLTSRWRTTTSAFANAASVPARSPTVQSKTTLFGAFSWSCGAPSASRLLGVDDGRQRLPVDLDRLERVDAPAAAVSAITAATPSPVHLTLSVASDPRRVHVVLDARRRRRPARPSAAGCTGCRRPTKTATTPGIRLGGRTVSIERMFACAYGLRRMAMWAMPGSLMSSR